MYVYIYIIIANIPKVKSSMKYATVQVPNASDEEYSTYIMFSIGWKKKVEMYHWKLSN